MQRLYTQDNLTYRETHREYTPEGFLRVPAHVAKTGIQKYRRRELGFDGDPNEIVTVYRPPEEVFSEQSLKTYDIADATFTHPGDLVNSENYRKFSVGVVDGAGEQDGDFVKATLLIKDADTIKKIERGISEVSAGYTADYFEESGTAPCGTKFDYVQRNIRINHVAIVPFARAGRQARIFDNQPEDLKTMHKITLDSGRQVEVENEATAMLVTDELAKLRTTISTNDAAHDAEKQRMQATIDAQEERIKELEKETDEEVIKEKVKKVAETKDAALLIAPKATFDSVSVAEIQRQALKVARPTVDWDAQTDVYVEAAFDMAQEFAKSKPANTFDSQMENLGRAAPVVQTQDAKPVQTAHERYKADFYGVK